MFDLAYSGSTAALRAVLSVQPHKVNDCSPDRGNSLLYTAARFGHLATCKMLVEEFNADIDVCNKENRSTPLHGAAFGGHADVVEYLLSRGAKQSANAYGERPLDNAKHPAESVLKPAAKATVNAFKAAGSGAGGIGGGGGTPSHTVTPVVAVSSPTPAISVPPPTLPPPPPIPPPVVTETVLLSTPTPAASLHASATSETALWESMTVAQLRSLLQTKGLSTAGTKAQLIARLSATPAPPATTTAVALPSSTSVGDGAGGGGGGGDGAMHGVKTDRSEAEGGESDVGQPPAKKPATESAVAASVSVAASSTTAPAAAAVSFDSEWIAKLRTATATQTEVVPNTQEFWDLEERVNAWNQGRNEDYVSNRIKKKKKPITFVLKRAWKVSNPVLEEAFAEMRKSLMSTLEDTQCRVRVAFHGTREENIPSILARGLLRFKHPLNPCTSQADDGYFGTNLKGVYVSRYYDYTLKYCNGLNPLDEGATAKTIMFKCLPGKVFNVTKLNMGMEPTPGFNSHSSPNNLEWYLFDERQLCPEYVIEMKAQIDTRTAADDE